MTSCRINRAPKYNLSDYAYLRSNFSFWNYTELCATKASLHLCCVLFFRPYVLESCFWLVEFSSCVSFPSREKFLTRNPGSSLWIHAASAFDMVPASTASPVFQGERVRVYYSCHFASNRHKNARLKGVSHEICRVLFWHVWIEPGLYKNLWVFLIFSVEPLILYLCLKFRRS